MNWSSVKKHRALIMNYSKDYTQAEQFFNENKDRLLAILLDENQGEIDHQAEFNQIAVTFDAFSLMYQDTDMNGETDGAPFYSNPGADDGLQELVNKLINDERFSQLQTEDDDQDMVFELVYLFCEAYAKKNNILETLKGQTLANVLGQDYNPDDFESIFSLSLNSWGAYRYESTTGEIAVVIRKHHEGIKPDSDSIHFNNQSEYDAWLEKICNDESPFQNASALNRAIQSICNP